MGIMMFAAIVVVAALVLITTIQHLNVIASPNEAKVLTGRKRKVVDENGVECEVGFRAVIGGRTLRIPIIERVQVMSLETIPLELRVSNAYSKGNIPLIVHAIANVKVASKPDHLLSNAVERLLDKTQAEIADLAKDTLTGNLRGVLATLEPEQVNEDRMEFARSLAMEAHTDLEKLGLQLDVLTIQNVSDEVGYLEAIGRQKSAEVLRRARVAEAENDRQARESEANNKAAAEKVEASANIEIAEANNSLRVREAELSQQAQSAELVADVEAKRAEVVAQQRLETERTEMQRRRYEAEVIVPAEANRRAAEEQARADAAPIEARGDAQAKALQKLFAEIGDKPLGYQVFMADKLPELLEIATRAVEGVDVDRIFIMDSNGEGVANASQQKVRASLQFMEGIASSVGIDLETVLQGAARKLTGGEQS
jgi:flotillin